MPRPQPYWRLPFRAWRPCWCGPSATCGRSSTTTLAERNQPMNIAEFQDRLDVYGADLAAWPDELAAPGRIAHRGRSGGTRLPRRGAPARCADCARRARCWRRPTHRPTACLRALARPLPRQRRFALSWAWPAALLDVDLAPARLRDRGARRRRRARRRHRADGTGHRRCRRSASASAETTIAAVFEPEPLTGVLP